MMREIESRYWIAPTLAASRSFLEPLQNGGSQKHGRAQAMVADALLWAARARSIMISVRSPVSTAAPTARYHGVTSAVDVAGDYIVASKGGDAILSINAAQGAA